MLPLVGSTCLFSLATKFASLDGVYTVSALSTFNDMIVNNQDFVANLYTPAGLAKADYIADFSSYEGGMVAIVQSVVDTSVTYYFPESILAMVPDPTVKKYQQIYMAIVLGAFKDTSTYSWAKTQVDAIMTAITGTTNQVKFMANPDNDVWLTDSEYAALDATRTANIKATESLYTQLQAALEAQSALQARIKTLEEAIVALGVVKGSST